MARTTSKRARYARAALLAAALLAALGLAACGNDNPADGNGTIRVNLADLKQELGGSSGMSTQAVGQDDSSATTSVKSLVIGAVVITFTDTPLSADTNITKDTQDKLTTDILNSINYFSIVDLPTSADFVEFKVPPPAAGHWQVAAVGTKDKIVVFEDLDSDSEGIYYGFEEQFRTTTGSTGPTVSLEMKRACFIDTPPKGCAAYGDNGKPVVTSTVTILDVLAKQTSAAGDGTSIGSSVGGLSFPIVVDGTIITAAAAKTALTAFVPTSGETITVVVSHPNAPGQSACSSVNHANYALTDTTCVSTFLSKY